MKTEALLLSLALALVAASEPTYAQYGRGRGRMGQYQIKEAPALAPWAPLPSTTQGLLPAPIFPSTSLRKTQIPGAALGLLSGASAKRTVRQKTYTYDPKAVRRVFMGTDRNGDGYLTLREVFLVLELDHQTFARMDRNDDQLISYTEFDDAYRHSVIWGGFIPEPPPTPGEAAETGGAAAAEGAPPTASTGPGERGRNLMKSIEVQLSMADRDADRLLDLEELKKLLQRYGMAEGAARFLNQYDFDGDFRIDGEELFAGILEQSGAKEEGPAVAMLEETRYELLERAPARAAALLQAMDLSDDGVLDPLEIHSAFYDTPPAIQQFQALERNGDGLIELSELEDGLARETALPLLVPLADHFSRTLGLGKVPTPIATLDADGDGTISLDELKAYLGNHPRAVPAYSVMAKFDEDRDHRLDLREFLGLLGHPVPRRDTGGATPARTAGPGRSPLPGPVRLLDRDDDGALSISEIREYIVQHLKSDASARQFFEKADRDKDGKLDGEELRIVFGTLPWLTESATPPSPVSPATSSIAAGLLAKADRDGNGRLDREELRGYIESSNLLLPSPLALIRSWDSDRDEQLDAAELDRAFSTERETSVPESVAPPSSPLPLALRALDTNGDQRLAPLEFDYLFPESEFPTLRRLFETFDRNLSGYLEAEELSWLRLH